MKKNLAAENNQDTKGFDDSQITMFLANWEMLEELVNEVYAKGQVESTDRDLFGSLKLALRRYYRYLSEELRPFWRQVKVAGKFLKVVMPGHFMRPVKDFALHWMLRKMKALTGTL